MAAASSSSSAALGGIRPSGHLAACVVLQDLSDERTRELPLVLARHRRQASGGVHPALLGEPVAYFAAQPLDETMIHYVTTPLAGQARGRAPPRARPASS